MGINEIIVELIDDDFDECSPQTGKHGRRIFNSDIVKKPSKWRYRGADYRDYFDLVEKLDNREHD